jgi:hypothetical protein
MIRIPQIAAVAACVFVIAHWLGAPLARALPGEQSQGPVVTANPPPGAEEIRALTVRAIENQHRNDKALEEYERTEHLISRKSENEDITTDVVERRVPSPAGDIKLKMTENGTPVPPEKYREELEFAVNALEIAAHPDDHYREAMAKYEKRRHDRAELVDAAAKAFVVTWAGRETRPDPTAPHGQRTLAKFLLDPDPNFKPANRFAASFEHVHAAIWVDEQEAQFARLEADIATDITFGGGVAGKVYHGGHITMEQREVAPGVWLPALFSYNVDGRKFLFSFGVHEHAEIGQYRHIGPPSQALQIFHNELSTLTASRPSRQ